MRLRIEGAVARITRSARRAASSDPARRNQGGGQLAAYSGKESTAGRLSRLFVVAVFAAFVAAAGEGALPPLDRDESRFAQASAQMLETGDFVTIRFQDEERNKKPAGIYWMQAASVALFSDAEAREIWAYRLPSALGAILAALFTYLAGARLYGPSTGFLAALLLAASPILAGEATIAKTDAMLLATTTIAAAALIHVFARWMEERDDGWIWPIVFWGALGIGVLVKGPIAPLVIGLAAIGLYVREPDFGWVKALRPLTGAAILVLMIGPWAAAVGFATEGRFFTEALGGDMGAKLGGAQESHGGPPGYHLLLLPFLMLPAAALIAPGFLQAFATRRAWPAFFLLAWIVPSWIIFEATPTKLPHYALPLYPAIAILAARAASIGASARRPIVRKIGACAFMLGATALAGAVIVLPHWFASEPRVFASTLLGASILVGGILAGRLFWSGRCYEGGLVSALFGLLVAWSVLEATLPKLDRMQISERLSRALDDEGLHPLRDGAPPVALAGYSEPSAVFLLGTATMLTDASGALRNIDGAGGAAIVEAADEPRFLALAEASHVPVRALATIDGLNYSNGRAIRLTVYARPAVE